MGNGQNRKFHSFTSITNHWEYVCTHHLSLTPHQTFDRSPYRPISTIQFNMAKDGFILFVIEKIKRVSTVDMIW